MRILWLSLALANSLAASTALADVITIEVDGSSLTHAHGINDLDRIVGFHHRSETGTTHYAFVREASGTFSSAGPDHPSFPCPPLCDNVKAHSINNAGDIAGTYGSGLNHSFIRTAAGEITTFDVEDSANTFADGINESLQVSGYFDDAVCPAEPLPCSHGFIRNPNGELIIFDVPGSTGTFPGKINNAGDVTGSYNDLEGNGRGFIRLANSQTFITFDVPGSVGTEAQAINDAGTVTGAYISFNPDIGYRRHGFVRSALGFTTVDVPGAHATIPSGINNDGDLVGTYDVLTADGRVTRGFVITADDAVSQIPTLSAWMGIALLLSLIALAVYRIV